MAQQHNRSVPWANIITGLVSLVLVLTGVNWFSQAQKLSSDIADSKRQAAKLLKQADEAKSTPADQSLDTSSYDSATRHYFDETQKIAQKNPNGNDPTNELKYSTPQAYNVLASTFMGPEGGMTFSYSDLNLSYSPHNGAIDGWGQVTIHQSTGDQTQAQTYDVHLTLSKMDKSYMVTSIMLGKVGQQNG